MLSYYCNNLYLKNIMNKPLKAIIFDLDGTLVNSLEDLAFSCNYVLKKFRYPQHELLKYKTFVGDGVFKLIERILPEEARNPEIIAKVKHAYESHYKAHCLDRTRPYDGFNELFYYIKSRGIKTAVVSNKPADFTKKIVNYLFKKYMSIDVIIGQSEFIPKKPDPKGMLYALELLEAKKDECIYIGDSDVDVITANNAGILCIGAAWGFRGETELATQSPAFIARSPLAVMDILRNEFQEISEDFH